MNFELFIAKRIFFNKELKKNVSKPIVTIAILGIALGLAIMILTVGIVTGFKSEIRGKFIGFGSHIQITNYDSNSSFELSPIFKHQSFYPGIEKIDGIKHIQVFATKPGVIKTKKDIEGVVLKGIDKDYDWSFFDKNMIKGSSFRVNDSVKTKDIVISDYLSSRLKLKVGDDAVLFFMQKPPRIRKFNIVGIYRTSLQELDKLYIFVDIKQIQKLEGWSSDQVSGFEVVVDDYDKIDLMRQKVQHIAGNHYYSDGSRLLIQTIKQKYAGFFGWIDLIDTNVWIILIIMLIVAGVNMISGLLILILERTNMIGVLKALGSKNASVRKIFIYNSAFLIGKGLFWGNIIGITICLIQQYFKLIGLDPESYYIDTVPIDLKVSHLLLLNAGTFIMIVLMMALPSYVITKIKPVKAIQFD